VCVCGCACSVSDKSCEHCFVFLTIVCNRAVEMKYLQRKSLMDCVVVSLRIVEGRRYCV